MSISSIKPEILLPEQEFVINRHMVIWQKPALIASITEQNNTVKLWVFQQIPSTTFTNLDDVESIECATNRDEIIKRISYAQVGCGHISKITIQGVELLISQSSDSIVRHNPMNHMKLQHFIEAGVDFSSMEDISFDELVLGEYQMAEGTTFPQLDAGADMSVSLTIRAQACEVLVEPTHRFNLEVCEHDIARSFHDPSDGREIVYYIDRVVRYDIWKETEERFRDEETLKIWREQGLDDAAIEQARASLPESLECICPKGHELLILQYESQEDYQLNFYTSEFLLGRPENTGSVISVAMIGTSDEESRHGHRVRSCLLKTVPLGFDGDVQVELVTWFKNIPDGRVEV